MEKGVLTIKKIYIEVLPHWEKGKNKGGINWEGTVGCSVEFEYGALKGSLEIIKYDKVTRKLTIKYNNKLHDILSTSFIYGNIGGVLGLKTSDFKVEIGTRFQDEKRDITIIDREYRDGNRIDGASENKKWYKYHCNVCGWNEGWIIEGDLLFGYSCSCCAGWTTVQGINDIPTTAPWLIPYFQGGYDEASLYTKYGGGNPNNRGGYIYPLCPDCGKVNTKKIKVHTIHKNRGFMCSCSDNYKYPNKFAHNILKQLNVDFETEFNPEWCKFIFKNNVRQCRYDFYFKLNNKEYILEMDGGWHRKDNKMNGQTKEESIFIDNEKDKLAQEHGIEVIRIDCDYDSVENRYEYIKQSILTNNKLNNLFDLNKIDWDKVEKFALSNLVKIACEYKRDNPDMSTTQIGRLMGYYQSTIANWLKQGSKIWGWINYDAEEESNKARLRTINTNKEKCSEQLICVTTGDIFSSIRECGRVSLKVFGVKLNPSLISAVCNGKRNHHHNLVFKKIKDLTEEQIKEIQENAKQQNIAI